MKIVFTGGGTGGHIFPLVAIARELRRLDTEKRLELHYLGPKDELANIYLKQEDFTIHTITSGKYRRYFSFQNIVDLLIKIPFGFVQSFFIMGFMEPIVVFSKGGSGSIAVTMAARLLGIPVFIHESDVVPGLSNQKTSKWAKKIFTAFPRTEFFDEHKVLVVGNPIRKEILEGDKKIAAQAFGLSLAKPVLLITGGSQGAEAVNDFVLNTLAQMLSQFELIHATGSANFKEVQAESQFVADKELLNYYHPIDFMDEEKTKHAYAAADLVIARSGSSNIFEIAACGKPSILVPLPTAAGNHQAKNAYQYAENGAAMVMEQDNMTPNFFMENLRLLFFTEGRLESMKQAALEFAKPLAARAVAREILEFCGIG